MNYSILQTIDKKLESVKTPINKLQSKLSKQKQNILLKCFKNDDYLNKMISKIENGHGDCEIEINDINGINYILELDLKQIKMPNGAILWDNDFCLAIEKYFCDMCIHYDNDKISISSSNDCFINYNNNEIYLYDYGSYSETKKFEDDLHLRLIIENFIKTRGYHPNFVATDYYGCFNGFYNFDDSMKFLQDNKNVYKILDLYNCEYGKNSLNDFKLIEKITPEELLKINNYNDVFVYIDSDNIEFKNGILEINIIYELQNHINIEKLCNRLGNDFKNCGDTIEHNIKLNLKQLEELLK
jgi:hypothetical protein